MEYVRFLTQALEIHNMHLFYCLHPDIDFCRLPLWENARLMIGQWAAEFAFFIV